jgi:hypothetical protein
MFFFNNNKKTITISKSMISFFILNSHEPFVKNEVKKG